ncbi:WD40 repeat protein [Krasilnikovia cinnamomea]|uniref:WD40 repeat protein n=1 Tax=Krasilnikovia cinnamomea TaxID=349313 RepID=A0A4Q7ZEJ4_9ACTN|nr:Hsp70 family protein [Krasilnikovia cinnamomea]RZU48495.1 WD40 repeat protein [Krasilnikovia cinnamomea]
MQYGLGVDLGTTQTAAAVRVDGQVEVLRLGGRRAEIPSLVFVKPDGGLLVGDAAERRGLAEPARLAREFKRRIGDPVPILVGGAPFSAHALTAKLLRHVLDTVTQLQDAPPATVTVTHPANWGPYKREQLDQAIRLADAGPVLLRTEPEAAALQHATARRIAPGEAVAVYDLGGGTFDAAVLRRDGDDFVLLGEPEGVEQLGGADFDEAVFGHVIEVLGSKAEGLDPNDPEVVTALARLRRDCVEAKEALSFDTEVMIPVALPGLHTRIRLNRSELEAMIAPSLEDTVAAMHRALRSAQLAPADLSAVLLAGGSSRIPLVAQLLSTAFERPVVADPHPEHSIAMGAAVATAATSGAAARPAPPASDGPVSPVRGPADTLVEPLTQPHGTAHAATAVPPVVPGVGGARPAEEDTTLVTPGPADAGAAQTGSSPAPAGAQGGETTPVAFRRGTATVPGSGEKAPEPGTGAAAPAGGAATATPASGAAGGAATATPASGAAGVGGGALGRRGLSAHPSGPTAAWSPEAAPNPFAAPGTVVQTVPGGRSGRRTKLLITAGAIVVAVLAAGTATAIALNRDKDSSGTGQNPPAVSAQPFPTDAMLIRVDTGGDLPPSRKSGVYQLTPGGDARTKVVDTGSDVLPEWSHDRKRIAITRNLGDTNEIWVMNADGSDQQKVIGNVTGGRTSWSADDKKLAFIRVVDKVPQMFVITLGESKPRQLTRSSAAKDDPAWSPDGKSIAYWVDVDGVRQIYLLSVDDPQEPGQAVTSGDDGPAVDPAWTPDGKTIAYTKQTGPGVSDIWAVDADGTDAHQVTNDPAREMDPTWAPDGTWLAFTRGELNKPRITVVKADGSQEQTLTPADAREGHPCWS